MVSNCGKAFSKAASRCRHGMLGEMSWLTSVVIAKCVAAYQDDTTVSRIAAAITGQAYCVHTSMARTTRAVIVFMSLVSRMGWSMGSADRWRGLRRQEKGEMVTNESRRKALDAPNGRKSEILDI